jgi:hypothetical protein
MYAMTDDAEKADKANAAFEINKSRSKKR